MDTKTLTPAPKARLPKMRKPRRLRGLLPLPLGQRWPGHWPGQPGPILGEPGPASRPPAASPLGPPLTIAQAAKLIGCSPWTVRQTLIPRGLPYFRFRASGRLTFYQGQVVRWIESQQQGGNKTK
jgi:hypothetical protein